MYDSNWNSTNNSLYEIVASKFVLLTQQFSFSMFSNRSISKRAFSECHPECTSFYFKCHYSKCRVCFWNLSCDKLKILFNSIAIISVDDTKQNIKSDVNPRVSCLTFALLIAMEIFVWCMGAIQSINCVPRIIINNKV